MATSKVLPFQHDHNAYHRGACRCPICTEAWRLHSKRRREHRLPPAVLDPTGTQRRVRGLMALGWTTAHIAAATGVLHDRTVSCIASGRCPTVLASTADLIRRAAADLGARPGPSNITRSRAARLGYLPLWVWDEADIDDPGALPSAAPPIEVDEVAVQRAVHAARADLPPTPLTRAELAVVVPRLAGGSFLTDRQIAERLRVAPRTVAKYRSLAGVKAATLDQQRAAA